ncbi:hypothetical protein MMSP_4530 [Mycobacterium sp. 012931]|nr:hypothetical protein MMSP_4530 [Mycobacterium sp. 012931]
MAPGVAGLAIPAGTVGGDPWRPASPGLRSPRELLVVTRGARRRRACDPH